MEDNVMQKQEDMDELRKMLDTVANQDKDAISKRKEELIDIRKYNNISFEIEQNGRKFTVTKNIFEVLLTKDGEAWHEFYDDQGNLLAKISDENYLSFKTSIEMGEADIDKNSLECNILSQTPEKSLLELENEQKEQVAEALGLDADTIKTLNILQTDGKEKGRSLEDKNQILDEKKKEAQEKLKQFMALGIEVDTREMATSDDTIKEFLQVDADKLLIVQINGDWRALEIDNEGKMHLAKNLEIVDNNQAFKTIGDDGVPEKRMPEIEFRRKDNPDISLAVDSNNKENQTQLYLIAGNSRSATELETKYKVSPYADAKNNELVQRAQENPDDERIVHPNKEDKEEEDKDPHEPSPRELGESEENS